MEWKNNPLYCKFSFLGHGFVFFHSCMNSDLLFLVWYRHLVSPPSQWCTGKNKLRSSLCGWEPLDDRTLCWRNNRTNIDPFLNIIIWLPFTIQSKSYILKSQRNIIWLLFTIGPKNYILKSWVFWLPNRIWSKNFMLKVWKNIIRSPFHILIIKQKFV